MSSAIPPTASSRRQVAAEVVVVWSTLALVSTIRFWPDLVDRILRDTDDATRLVQVRELLAGQSWWDLTLDRIGLAGVEMHWSRHMDGLLAGPITILRPVIGVEAAELASMIIVPLALLLVALLLISSLARLLWPRQDVGLYAMIAFGLGASVLNRLGPGGLDHHGLQIVLVLLTLRMVQGPPSWRSGLGAGAAAGVSLTVGLETFPVLAAALAGVGIVWAYGSDRPKAWYQSLGVGLVSSGVASSLLFGPPGRLQSLECDVLSLGFFGLIALPALALAAVGGRKWSQSRRWVALGVMALVGFAWFGIVSPECHAGPYGSVPEVVHRIWIDLISETRGLLSIAARGPLDALGYALGPVVAFGFLARMTLLNRKPEWFPLSAALLMAMALGLWQVRTMPVAMALAAPVLGVVVVRIRDAAKWEPGRALVAVAAVLVLSGFPFGFIQSSLGSRSDAAAMEPCVTGTLLEHLDELEPGLIAAEVDIGPAILVHTDHRVLASPYHRAYEGVLAVYELFIADSGSDRRQAEYLGVSYVVVCDNSPLSDIWSADNEDGLLAALLDDDPPQWLEKVIDTGRTRVYAVR